MALHCIVLLSALLPQLVMASQGDGLEGLDAFIVEQMAREKVPGMVIVVIRDGEVVYRRSFGASDVDASTAMGAAAVFPIASLTKSFTALLLAQMAQDGEIDLDRPVRGYAPDFQLHDADATSSVSLRDLLSHRSGLPRHDAIWHGTDVTRERIWAGLRHLESSAKPGERYQYNNLMYMAAGEVATRMTGADSWEALLHDRVLAPMGMTNTFSGGEALGEADRVVTGYRKVNGTIQRAEPADLHGIAPAGSLHASIDDMARYLTMHLADGRVYGERVFDAAVLQVLRVPLIRTDAVTRDPETGDAYYGMGLQLAHYRGQPQVYHGGSIDGFSTFLSYLPEHGIGVVMLENLEKSGLRHVVPRHVYDRLLGLTPIDWSTRLDQRRQQDEEQGARDDSGDAACLVSPSTDAQSDGLERHVGTYSHPAYGVLAIDMHEGRLAATYGGRRFMVERQPSGVFVLSGQPWDPIEGRCLRFDVDAAGNTVLASVPMDTSVPAIVFARLAD